MYFLRAARQFREYHLTHKTEEEKQTTDNKGEKVPLAARWAALETQPELIHDLRYTHYPRTLYSHLFVPTKVLSTT